MFATSKLFARTLVSAAHTPAVSAAVAAAAATAVQGAKFSPARKSVPRKDPTYSRPSGYFLYNHSKPFLLESEKVLPSLEIAYETWGTLNKDRSNAILLHTGLSASSHAKSHPLNPERGWWEDFIGPGCALDTNQYFIICCNNLGGCFGSTGPSSLAPDHKPYALRFPYITVADIVRSQLLVLDHLKIDRVHASIGSSLGGMESITTAALFPERVSRLVSISASAMSNPMSIAMRYLQRQSLMMDPHFNGGNYYDGPFPERGMRLAREMATITYRSGEEWESRFGRQKVASFDRETSSPTTEEFEVESYLRHQGDKWCKIYDPNSIIVLSKAMDTFNLKQNLLRRVLMPTLIMGCSSDLLFPIHQQRQIAEILKKSGNPYVIFYRLDSPFGHDTFLIDVNSVGAAIKGHLDRNV